MYDLVVHDVVCVCLFLGYIVIVDGVVCLVWLLCGVCVCICECGVCTVYGWWVGVWGCVMCV